MAQPTGLPRAPKIQAREVLKRARFETKAGHILELRSIKRDSKSAGILFRVEWRQRDPSGTTTASGTKAIESYADKADIAFKKAHADAMAGGWTEAVWVTGRKIELTDIPTAPGTKRKP